MKTKPITLPIDPAKAHLYVARNGVGVEFIRSTTDFTFFWNCHYNDGANYLLTTEGFVIPGQGISPHDLTHEIIPEPGPEAQGRDWSEVVDKLIMLANRTLLMNTYKMQSWIDTDAFQPQALAILQEFDAQTIQTPSVCIADEKDSNKPEETAPTEEPLEFVVGTDRGQPDWFATAVSDSTIVTRGFGKFGDGEPICYVHRHDKIEVAKEGDSVVIDENGTIYVKKHIPAPKTHDIDVWLNVYDNRDYYAFVHQSKQEANDESDKDRVACLRFKRTFTEGEGLQ